MTPEPGEVIERLLFKAIEQQRDPQEFLKWVEAYKQALVILGAGQSDRAERSALPAEGPLTTPPASGMRLTHGLLHYHDRQVSLPARVEDLIRLLYAHAGAPLSLQEIEAGIPGMAPTSIYPTISRARECLHHLGLPSDVIIRTVGRRGSGGKAQYLWNPDFALVI